MGKIIALAVKDLRTIWRDKAGLFFLFFFPVILAVFFGFIFSGTTGGEPGERKIAVLLVDEDGTEGSAKFARTIAAAKELNVVNRVRAEGPGDPARADTPVAPEAAPFRLEPITREEAQRRVSKREAAAYIALPPGFGRATEGMFWEGGATVELGFDPSRRAEVAMLKGMLLKGVFEGMKDQFGDRGKMLERLDAGIAELDDLGTGATGDMATWADALRKLREAMSEMPEAEADGEGGGWYGFAEPLTFEERSIAEDEAARSAREKQPTSSFHISFPQGMVWGLLGAAATFGISIVVERVRGTLVRLRTAPITRAHILAGKGLACFFSMIVVMVALTLIGTVGLGMPVRSFSMLAVAIVCSSLCFVGLMMFVSVLGKTEQSAGGFGWMFMLALSMVGGGSIPLFFMPDWLRPVAAFSPVRWAVEVLEIAIWRRWLGWGDMVLPCLILLGTGVAFFTIGVVIFRRVHNQ